MPVHTAAILAGGQSRRMGADKALLPLAGISLLERVARTAAQVCPNLLIVGRAAPPPNWPADLPATFIADAAPNDVPPSGPLLGLITALQHTRAPILLLACDTPLLTPPTLRELLRAHEESSQDARMATLATSLDPTGQVQAEPTLAIYTPALLPTLQTMLAENRRSLQPLLHHPGIHTWSLPPERTPELLNVNDPATLQIAERLLQSR